MTRFLTVLTILAFVACTSPREPAENVSSLENGKKIAAESLDIKVLDHLIITEKAYFSFADEKIL